jgi:hypothetical protein
MYPVISTPVSIVSACSFIPQRNDHGKLSELLPEYFRFVKAWWILPIFPYEHFP